jgi:hypothetical protein
MTGQRIGPGTGFQEKCPFNLCKLVTILLRLGDVVGTLRNGRRNMASADPKGMKLLAWGLSMSVVGALASWVFFGLLG